MGLLSVEKEKEILRQVSYDPESGLFFRNGTQVGWYNDSGYLLINFLGEQVRLHRLAFLFMTGKQISDDLEVDHVNHTRDDNRWLNLRPANRSQNRLNTGVARSDSQSGIKGVRWCKKRSKWLSLVNGPNGKLKRLGRYNCPLEAQKVRDAYMKNIHGDRYACLS